MTSSESAVPVGKQQCGLVYFLDVFSSFFLFFFFFRGIRRSLKALSGRAQIGGHSSKSSGGLITTFPTFSLSDYHTEVG